MTHDPASLNGASQNGTVPAHADDEINLRDVWDLLVRNWGVITLVFLAAIGGAALFSILTVPVYQSVSSIRIEDDEGPAIPLFEVLGNLSGGASQVETEMAVLGSRVLTESVVDSLGLTLSPTRPRGLSRAEVVRGLRIERWAPEAVYQLTRQGDHFEITNFETGALHGTASVTEAGRVPGARFRMAPSAFEHDEIRLEVAPFDLFVEGLREKIGVGRINRDANLVVVRYASTDTAMVRAVPNLLARIFIERRQEVQSTEARSTVAFLEQQIDTLERQLEGAEDLLVAFEQGEQVISLTAEADAQVEQLAGLQAQRMQIENNRKTLQDLVD
ncbi:MAG: Wzz/FepE/Etk N-terminal domain-containing protein, partial [Longimicrobiales bacterium]|nr:Wzz/FepE/Etk N-terminal domain-containing protein [Longimicrobiales bacterium]